MKLTEQLRIASVVGGLAMVMAVPMTRQPFSERSCAVNQATKGKHQLYDDSHPTHPNHFMPCPGENPIKGVKFSSDSVDNSYALLLANGESVVIQ